MHGMSGMCYEFWQHTRKQQQQDAAARRVRDIIEKAKTATLPPKADQRPATEKETVPA